MQTSSKPSGTVVEKLYSSFLFFSLRCVVIKYSPSTAFALTAVFLVTAAKARTNSAVKSTIVIDKNLLFFKTNPPFQASPRRRLRDGGVCLVAGCFPLYIKTPQRNWNSYIILCYLSGAGGLRRCGKGAKRSLLISAAKSQASPFYSAVGTGVEPTEN